MIKIANKIIEFLIAIIIITIFIDLSPVVNADSSLSDFVPLDLCIVLDKSGSMKYPMGDSTKIAGAKNAAINRLSLILRAEWELRSDFMTFPIIGISMKNLLAQIIRDVWGSGNFEPDPHSFERT